MKRKSTYKEICKLTLAAASIGVFSASAAEAVEIKDVLENYVEATVLPTYSQMSDSAIEFNKAVAKLKESASDENLAKAAAAWSKVRTSWERSEAFLFGPAAFASLDPNLDSWPLDQSQLDSLIKAINEGRISIDAGYVRGGLGAAFRGFHAAEYLLFREGKVRKAAEMSKGELEYLAVYHILFTATMRINKSDPGNMLQAQLVDYTLKKYPHFEKNKYYKCLLSQKDRISIWFLRHKLFRMLHLILDINRKLKDR